VIYGRRNRHPQWLRRWSFIEQEKTYHDLIEQTVEIEFRGHIMHVLDIRTLIDLKKTSKDPKDRQRLPVLEETLRQLEKK
jgi:hypothetical protein